MISKNRLFHIDKDDIFANDKLDRKDAIENLSSLLLSTEEAFTMSINADWGTGKTIFVKLWKNYLEKEHSVRNIYFSAWEDDFSQEPLISILGEISKYISDNFKTESKIVSRFNDVKCLGGKVLKRGLPAFIKGATGGLLDIDKGFESAIGALSEEATKELIDNYSEDKKIVQKFKESIQELLENIDNTKPFVIFIDELDRCRPLYAIELLERVKHIFGIDGLIFVFSIDKKQLTESIKSQYGNIDAYAYLKRFIDLEYNLKNISVYDFCNILYDKYRFEELLQNKCLGNSYGTDLNILEMLGYVTKAFHLTLRDIEQVFIQVSIVFKTIKPNLDGFYFKVFVFLIALRLKNTDLYLDLVDKRKKYEELKKVLLYKEGEDENLLDVENIIKSIILSTSKSNQELEEITDTEKEKLSTMDINNREYFKQEFLVVLLSEKYGEYRGFRLNNLIQEAIKKIEFVDKFNFNGSI